MNYFTILNHKALNTRKRTYSISKRFAILLIIIAMAGSKALADDNYEMIDGLKSTKYRNPNGYTYD